MTPYIQDYEGKKWQYSHETGKWMRKVQELLAEGKDNEELFDAARHLFFSHKMFVYWLSDFNTPKWNLWLNIVKAPPSSVAREFINARADQYVTEKLASINTPPDDPKPAKVPIAFGADFHQWGLGNQKQADMIRSWKPVAMLLYGDIAVQDRNNHFGLHRADYLLRDFNFYEFEAGSLGGRTGPPPTKPEWNTQFYGISGKYALGEFTIDATVPDPQSHLSIDRRRQRHHTRTKTDTQPTNTTGQLTLRAHKRRKAWFLAAGHPPGGRSVLGLRRPAPRICPYPL